MLPRALRAKEHLGAECIAADVHLRDLLSERDH